MLDKMIGVSPPQAGKAHESEVRNSKDFRGSGDKASQYRLDFEKALKEKAQAQKRDLEKRNETERRDELRAEKNRKSSGGTKKKMTEVDDKMVSNGMASKENVVEIPVSKEQETAKIKVSSEKANETVAAGQEALVGALTSQKEALQESPSANLSPLDAEVSVDAEVPLNAEQMKALKAMQEAQQAAQAESTGGLNAVEKELGAAVQYESQKSVLKEQTDAGELPLNKSEKAAQSTAQRFEKDVLAQLQRDSSGMNSGSFSQSEEKGSFDKESSTDLKGEVYGNDLHQAAGQSHTGFKAHLDAVQVTKGLETSQAMPEGQREANINEIMNQAQYLVKKGGGEVSVTMSPEGMGQVQLKVQLLNGKLNIEMQTHDREVKKMIEDSLSDLKSGLAAHRLSLEHVKIDTVNATNADNTAQMQSNLHQGQDQSRSRDFFGELQQQSQQGSHHGGQRGSNRESGLNIAPSSISSVSQAQGLRTYGGTKGATINRVA